MKEIFLSSQCLSLEQSNMNITLIGIILEKKNCLTFPAVLMFLLFSAGRRCELQTYRLFPVQVHTRDSLHRFFICLNSTLFPTCDLVSLSPAHQLILRPSQINNNRALNQHSNINFVCNMLISNNTLTSLVKYFLICNFFFLDYMFLLSPLSFPHRMFRVLFSLCVN